jgi:hypothetical protein
MVITPCFAQVFNHLLNPCVSPLNEHQYISVNHAYPGHHHPRHDHHVVRDGETLGDAAEQCDSLPLPAGIIANGRLACCTEDIRMFTTKGLTTILPGTCFFRNTLSM